MGLQVVGAGLGRTGTHSLKLALEQLLGGPCYHMIEVFGRPDDVPVWQRAAEGEPVDWEHLFTEFRAAVDWPVASFWREVSATFPDSIILLSTRDPDGWWTSASRTIFEAIPRAASDDGNPEWDRMIDTMFAARFTSDFRDEARAKAAYTRHNADVRATAPPDRLVEWETGAGWGPLCEALRLPVPDTPFPHVNTTDEFRAMSGLDRSE